MSEMKKINDEQMNEIAGGKDYRVQNSNFCPRCRMPSGVQIPQILSTGFDKNRKKKRG